MDIICGEKSAEREKNNSQNILRPTIFHHPFLILYHNLNKIIDNLIEELDTQNKDWTESFFEFCVLTFLSCKNVS